MTAAIWIVLAALALALFIVCGALVEMYRSLEQVRERSGASDAPTKIDVELESGVLAQAGLDAELGAPERALLLILSDRCTTCDVLAAAMGGWVPDDVRVLLHPSSAESARRWLTRHGLLDSPSVIVDTDNHISDVIGIHITPTALRISSGEVLAAHTVPSSRRLFEELGWIASGGPDEPQYQSPGASYHEVMHQVHNKSVADEELTKGTAG
ncbi:MULTISPECIES: hypothetical protein [unclassified Streptomyces]|uniref:hypothetical protein n=1 Tax=unclassified Streptomyces TaxID=2593676 RepID=UPI002E16FBBC